MSGIAGSRRASIQSLPMAHPGDVAELAALIDAGSVMPADVMAILIKTEGNGLDNDFTRVMAIESVERLLGPSASRSIIASGGCEGVTTPHMTVVAATEVDTPARSPRDARLAIGRAVSRRLQPEDIGRTAQVFAVRDAVAQAIQSAALATDEVRYVEVKAPLLTASHVAAARGRGAATVATDAHASKPFSRGACGLGIGAALGEIDINQISDAMIAVDSRFFTRRGCVTGGELHLQAEVIVFGNSAQWVGELRVASACLADLLDVEALDSALAELGLHGAPQLTHTETARLRAIMFKGDAPRDGRLRGERHVMWHDSDVHANRHLRATAAAVIGARTGFTRVFAGAGAEHQGPQGGGTLAIFAVVGEN